MFRLWSFKRETSLTYSFTLLFGRLVSLSLFCHEDFEHLSLAEPLQELCHAVSGSIVNKLLLLQHKNQNLYFLSQAVASERSLTRKEPIYTWLYLNWVDKALETVRLKFSNLILIHTFKIKIRIQGPLPTPLKFKKLKNTKLSYVH